MFRFNRDFYDLDDRGRPVGYRNLDQLHARIKPYMLRRRKADVETELPDRTDRNHFVPLSGKQQLLYADHALQVSRLSQLAERRPLTQQEQEKLQRELAMCRMICDTNYILDPNERACPKLAELERILEECRDNSEVKVLIASETGGPPPLTEEEKSKAAAYRQAASRKLKMARVLGSGDFLEEARTAILDAIQPLARALAVENRLPEPASLEDALLPPLSHTWGEALTCIRQSVNEPTQPWPPVLEVLDKV